MTKERYMALADVQSLWSNSMKPWIMDSIESIEMDDETGDINVSFDDGTEEEEETNNS